MSAWFRPTAGLTASGQLANLTNKGRENTVPGGSASPVIGLVVSNCEVSGSGVAVRVTSGNGVWVGGKVGVKPAAMRVARDASSRVGLLPRVGKGLGRGSPDCPRQAVNNRLNDKQRIINEG